MMGLVTISVIAVIILGMIFGAIYIGKKHNEANWGHPAANVIDGWLRLYCKRYHRQGAQSIDLPTNEKFLLASNHLSAIDPFLLIAATNRPIRFMIAQEEYQKPILNWMFKAAGCIPVDRTGRVEKAFRSALRAINSGEVVALFPQGGIHSTENPREFIKPGIVRLSQLSQCAVLPVRIRGISAPGTMVECLYKRSQIQLDIGQLLTTETVSGESFKPALSDWLVEKTKVLSL